MRRHYCDGTAKALGGGSVALYHDPLPYFPHVQHHSGLITGAESRG
jgi:hypothetical protein